MGKKFAEYSKLDLSEVNGKVLKKWDENQVFAKSMTEREGCPSFVFFEGPPSANGMPGMHHVMARSIKDIFCRYKTMKGFQVKRKAGWDTHGLPVELGVEKALGITTVSYTHLDVYKRQAPFMASTSTSTANSISSVQHRKASFSPLNMESTSWNRCV